MSRSHMEPTAQRRHNEDHIYVSDGRTIRSGKRPNIPIKEVIIELLSVISLYLFYPSFFSVPYPYYLYIISLLPNMISVSISLSIYSFLRFPTFTSPLFFCP